MDKISNTDIKTKGFATLFGDILDEGFRQLQYFIIFLCSCVSVKEVRYNLLSATVARCNMCCWLTMSTTTRGSKSASASWQVSSSQWASGLPARLVCSILGKKVPVPKRTCLMGSCGDEQKNAPKQTDLILLPSCLKKKWQWHVSNALHKCSDYTLTNPFSVNGSAWYP